MISEFHQIMRIEPRVMCYIPFDNFIVLLEDPLESALDSTLSSSRSTEEVVGEGFLPGWQ